MRRAVANAKENKGRAAFVAFFTCGYPTIDDAVDIMLGLEAGGADVIELGVPFSDPIADGPTIQMSSHVALQQGVTLQTCFDKVRDARSKGLVVPVVLMGYYNPVLCFGEAETVSAAREAGVNGFIIVDLPPCGPESQVFRERCTAEGLALVPLVAPTTSTERLQAICATAAGFVYCVAVTGVTGGRTELPAHLKDYVARVRSAASGAPLAVGFGISDHKQFCEVAQHADGVVVGSAIIKLLQSPPSGTSPAAAVENFARMLTTGESS